MSKTQEQIAKDLYNHGTMREHGRDKKGNIIMVDRQRDNLTTTGIVVGTDGKISKYNR